MVDTGAHMSMIRNEVAEEIGLSSRGTATLLTFAGPHKVPTYAASLRFDDGFVTDAVVAGGDFKEDLDFLVGRDLLRYATFTFNGPGAQIEIAFTSPEQAA